MIRTVHELVAPEDVGVALPHEHVLHNIGSCIATISPSLELEIRTEDLVDYRRNALAHGGRNLMMHKEDEAFRELERLQSFVVHSNKKLNPLVVDVTLPTEGRDTFAQERLRLAERLPGLNLLTVTTFSMEKLDDEFSMGLTPKEQSQRIAKVLEAELMFGIDNGSAGMMYPGAIYQQIHSSDPQLNAKQQILAEGLALVQAQTHAPLYLSFTCGDASEGRIAKLEQSVHTWIRALLDGGAEPRKLVICHADRWCRTHVGGSGYEFLLKLFASGVSVLFNMVGLLAVSDSMLINPCTSTITIVSDDESQEPPPDSRLAKWMSAILNDHPAYLGQTLLSTNVHQRIQYRRYGGGGYTYLFEMFKQRLLRQNITETQWDQIVRGNVVKLLAWYEPPEAPPIPKNYLQCSICSNVFEPIEGEYFTKFAFIYCGTKCLRRHSKHKFAPLPSTN